MFKYVPVQKLTSLCTTIAFVYITSMSLLIAFSHTDVHNHTDTPVQHTCPFMAHTTSWCPMIMTEHLDIWRQLTNLLIPSLSLVYLTTFLAHQKYTRHTIDIQSKSSTITLVAQQIHQWIVQLFSQGILHTKIP